MNELLLTFTTGGWCQGPWLDQFRTEHQLAGFALKYSNRNLKPTLIELSELGRLLIWKHGPFQNIICGRFHWSAFIFYEPVRSIKSKELGYFSSLTQALTEGGREKHWRLKRQCSGRGGVGRRGFLVRNVEAGESRTRNPPPTTSRAVPNANGSQWTPGTI